MVAVSELGTRIVMCERVGGSGVMVTHDRDGNPVLTVQDGCGGSVEVVLSQREALSVVEALVVAAKPGATEATVYTDPAEAAKRIAADIAKRTGRDAIDTEGVPVAPSVESKPSGFMVQGFEDEFEVVDWLYRELKKT